MNYKAGEIELSRLKNLLVHDKVSTPNQLTDVIKSDIYSVLSNYMELYSDDLKVLVDADEKGYHLMISAHTNRFKQVGMLPKLYNLKND